MTFEEEGFLSEEVVEESHAIFQNHKEHFNLCFDINRSGQRLKRKINIHSQDPQEFVAAILFNKMMEGLQASVLLINRGFSSEPMALMRVMLENLFVLKRCCQNRNFSSEYLAFHEKQRLNLINWANNQPGDSYPLLQQYATEELKAELEEKIQQEGIEGFSNMEILAHDAGMGQYYGIYKYLSSFVHVPPKSLERYLILDEENSISGITHGPDESNVRANLITLADFMILAIQSMDGLFDLEESPTIDKFKDRLKELTAGFDTDSAKV